MKGWALPYIPGLFLLLSSLLNPSFVAYSFTSFRLREGPGGRYVGSRHYAAQSLPPLRSCTGLFCSCFSSSDF
jgi:hypothetical protein